MSSVLTLCLKWPTRSDSRAVQYGEFYMPWRHCV